MAMDGETVTVDLPGSGLDGAADTALAATLTAPESGAPRDAAGYRFEAADALGAIAPAASPLDLISPPVRGEAQIDPALLDPSDPLIAQLAAAEAQTAEADAEPNPDAPITVDPAALRRALAGDAEALAALPESVRAAMTPEPVESEPAPLVTDGDREAFGRWDELLDLSFSNPTYFAQVVAGNPAYSGFIAQMQKLAAGYGLPANATGAQLEAAVLHDRVRRIQTEARAVRKSAEVTPQQTLAELRAEPDAAALTAEDWDALKALPSVRAVEREYGKRLAVRQAQQRAKGARSVAQKTAQAAQAAQAAGERVMPTATNGGLPPSTFADLERAFITAAEQGTLTPDLQSAYFRASRARESGSSTSTWVI